jgi:Flp pilus assembly protein TadB
MGGRRGQAPEATLDDLVRAQNRTTHAIRSLALYFFISLQTSLLGVGIIALWPDLAVLGAIIIIVGFYAAVWYGRSELNMSKP